MPLEGRGTEQLCTTTPLPLHPPSPHVTASFSTTTQRNATVPSVLHSPSSCLPTLSSGSAPAATLGCVSRVACMRPVVAPFTTGAQPAAGWGGTRAHRLHLLHCEHCSPDAREAIRESRAKDQENRMQAVEDNEDGHSPTPHPLHAAPHLSHTARVDAISLHCMRCVQRLLHLHGGLPTHSCGR